jgi:hypothetical protein
VGGRIHLPVTDRRKRKTSRRRRIHRRQTGGETLLYGGKGKNFNVKYVIYGITG